MLTSQGHVVSFSSTCESNIKNTVKAPPVKFEKANDRERLRSGLRAPNTGSTKKMSVQLLMLAMKEVRLVNQVSGIPLMQICPTISHWRWGQFPDLSLILFDHFSFFFL